MKRPCNACGKPYEASHPTSKFCSGLCRKRASRGHIAARAPTVPVSVLPGLPGAEPAPAEGVTVVAVRRQLDAVERTDTYLGAAALSLAERIDGSSSTMGFAALVKELRATMDAALEGTDRTVDLLDELRARRDRKHTG